MLVSCRSLALAATLVLATAACSGGDEAGSAPPVRPGETWYRVTSCSSVGPVSIDMPGPVRIEGPRPLANLNAPTEGTFAVSYGSSDARRYDALVIDDAGHRGPDDEAIATAVLRHLDGDPSAVELGSFTTVGGHVEVPYEETFNDRRLHAHALAGRGVVFAFDVGVREGSGARVVDMARSDLAHMRSSVSFPGLDGDAEGDARCAPSQEPLSPGAGTEGEGHPLIDGI